MFCTATDGGNGRCKTCSIAPEFVARDLGAETLDAVKTMVAGDLADAIAFCTNRTNRLEAYCDDSTTDEETCGHPACRACPVNPGWGVPYGLAVSRAGRGQVDLRQGEFGDAHLENSTWGTTSERTITRGSTRAMKYSDTAVLLVTSTVVSFSLAREVRDIKLCEITMHGHSGSNQPWKASWLQWAFLVASCAAGVGAIIGANSGVLDSAMFGIDIEVLYAADFFLILPGVVTYIDVRCGNSPWRIFLVTLNAMRRFMIVPMLSATVATLVLFDSSNAKDIALNSVGALCLLEIDNTAFASALPDQFRKYVEEYGRAEIGDRGAAVLNAAKMWTCLPMLVAMLLPVVEAKYFLDDAGAERDWLVDPYGTVWFTALYAGYVGIFEEVLAGGRGEIGKKALTPLDEAALGVVVGGVCGNARVGGWERGRGHLAIALFGVPGLRERTVQSSRSAG